MVSVDGILTVKVNHSRAMEPSVSVMYFPFMHIFPPLEFPSVFFIDLVSFCHQPSPKLCLLSESLCVQASSIFSETLVYTLRAPLMCPSHLAVFPPLPAVQPVTYPEDFLWPLELTSACTRAGLKGQGIPAPEAAVTLDSWKLVGKLLPH